MKYSDNKKQKKYFSDVSSSLKKKKKWKHWLLHGGKTVDLKPTFFKRHPFLVVATIGIAAIIFFAARFLFFTRAAVVDFYPSNCFGTWTNVANAEGDPENMALSLASSTFDTSNSATFDNSSTEIFCGGFVPPSYTASGTIQSVGLTLVWNVQSSSSDAGFDASNQSPTTGSSTTSTVSGDTSSSGTSSTDVIDASSSLQLQNSTSTNTTSTSFFDGWKNFILTAFAQTDPDTSSDQTASLTPAASSDQSSPSTASSAPASSGSDQSAPSPVVTPSSAEDTQTSSSLIVPATQSTTAPIESDTSVSSDSVLSAETSTIMDSYSSSDSSTPIILGQPIGVSLMPIGSSTVTSTASSSDNSDASTTQVVIAPPTPDDNFLEIDYSTDGQTWVNLEKVNLQNWQNLTISVPVNDWNDLRNLQVRIEGIPTSLQQIPVVSLDGMFMEVHYAGDEGLMSATYPHFLLDKKAYEPSDTISITNAPPNSFIEIYSLDESVTPNISENVYGIQVTGGGWNTAAASSLPPGNYIFVNTFEPGECNEFTLDECRMRNDYIGELPVTILSDGN